LQKRPEAKDSASQLPFLIATKTHDPKPFAGSITHKPQHCRVPFPRERRIKPPAGTWLFGGRFAPSFGHFLTETLSRLWALDHIDIDIEGVLFFPTINAHAEPAAQLFGQLSEILDTPIRYKICDEFFRVDSLVIPQQGIGIGRLMVSSPEMRAYIKKHLKRDFEPTGHDKIYISHSGSFGKNGRSFLGETYLEDLLRDEDYTILHPQDHSWSEQLRHQLSATHVLGPDGSPFHLVNFTGRSDLNVGVIQRRPGHVANQMATQGTLFGIENINTLPHLGGLWASAGSQRAGLSLLSEVKFSTLCTDLKKRGFINKNAKWKNLTKTQMKTALLEHAKAADADQHQVESASVSLAGFPRLADDTIPQVFFKD
jgi:hypothetical protein